MIGMTALPDKDTTVAAILAAESLVYKPLRLRILDNGHFQTHHLRHSPLLSLL